MRRSGSLTLKSAWSSCWEGDWQSLGPADSGRASWGAHGHCSSGRSRGLASSESERLTGKEGVMGGTLGGEGPLVKITILVGEGPLKSP